MRGTTPFVILAAGASSRMGRPKALLPFQGGTWLEAQVAALRVQGLGPLILVLAPEEEAPLPLAARLGLEVRRSPDPSLGPFASLQAGLRDQEGPVFVSPLDVPFSSNLGWLREALGEAEAAVPTFEGRGGHPVLLGAALVVRLRALDPRDPEARLDRQLRRAKVARVELGDSRVRMNLNTPEAWEAFDRAGRKEEREERE